jgi:DNA-binding Lrp family transcriptional regulator
LTRRRPRVAADSPSVLRRMNSAVILEVIQNQGPLSRAEIARATGLSKPTVNDVVGLLLEQTYVRESRAEQNGDRPRRPGPRARLLTFRADLGHVLGIDVGANKALALVADLSGRILATERREVSRQAQAGQEDLLRELEATAAAAVKAAGVTPASLRAVGVVVGVGLAHVGLLEQQPDDVVHRRLRQPGRAGDLCAR